jgi:small redox-active disulfide protein 2
MLIKVLGSGCANCKTLELRTAEALQLLKIDAHIEKITDYQRIAEFGVMRTPGLVIDNKVVLQGRVPTVAQLQEIITNRENA